MKNLTSKIFIALVLGIIIGITLFYTPAAAWRDQYLLETLQLLGKIFLVVIKMVVVPIVLVSLICGVCNIGGGLRLGRIAVKTVALYIVTTAIAIALALFVAWFFGVGGDHAVKTAQEFIIKTPPPLKDTILNIFPSNPFTALAKGNMLQIIFFALLFGMAINVAGTKGRMVKSFFESLNEVLMKLIILIMRFAPYGVFCLITVLFAKTGFQLIGQLLGYFFTVLAVLIIHWLVIYGLLLVVIARLNPVHFFRKIYTAMLFAFSVSSSNASIPVTLDTCKNALGVSNSAASFVIPLGATINMDGTAIMQGVATVFVANLYGIHLGLTGYLMVILMATLASIGTAGVPSAGLITLAMVFQQVGLPVEGIAIIFGVDRLLDMARTAINISGDSMVACAVAKSEGLLDLNVYRH